MSQPGDEPDDKETRIARLFWVYLSALALLFLCVVASLVITDIEARHLTTDAQRINLSGRQRTHSQRILHLAGSIATGGPERREELAQVVAEFEAAHAYLIDAAQEYPAIRDSYLAAPGPGRQSLDTRIRTYVADARRLLEAPSDTRALRRLHEVEATGLLGDLDGVVGLFEANSTRRIELLRYLEFYALITAILIVAIELFFVFRPGHELLKRTFADLRGQNRKLALARAELERSNAALAARNREVEAERARLDAALADSEALRREQAGFTYALSHDLKSPANTIGLLLDEIGHTLPEDSDPETLRLLGHGRQAIRRMSLLIRDTLDYSLATENRATAEDVDMEACVRDVLQDLHADITASGAVIEVGPLCSLHGHAAQLRMLVQNLLANAMRYQPPGATPRIKISCTAQAPDGPALLRVSDNGIGIAPEDQARIFGLFQRLHLQTDYPGSGLGLATCQRIALNHAGGITVRSAPGEGSTFDVTLDTPLSQNTPQPEDLAA